MPMRTLKTAILAASIAFAATAANASTTDLTTIGAEVRDSADVTIVELTQTQPTLEMNKSLLLDSIGTMEPTKPSPKPKEPKNP